MGGGGGGSGAAADAPLLGKALARGKGMRRQSMPPALVAAEVAKTNAEAATQLRVQGKLQAEQNKLEFAVFRACFTWLAAAAIAVVLAADYYLHESPWLVKRRMRRMLLSFELPGATAVLPAELLEVPQAPLVEQIATKPSEELRHFIFRAANTPIAHPPLVLRGLSSPRRFPPQRCSLGRRAVAR